LRPVRPEADPIESDRTRSNPYVGAQDFGFPSVDAASETRILRRMSKRLAVVGILAPLTACTAKDPPPSLIAFGSGSEVWVVESGGTNPRKLVADKRYGPRPLVWSPDGKTLIYWKHSKIGWDLWSVDVSSRTTKNLTHVKNGGCRSASFSPDGKRIAFLRDKPPGVYLMNADGRDERRLTNLGFRDEAPSWAPDSNRLVICHFDEVNGKSRATLHLIDVRRGLVQSLRGKVCFGTEAKWQPGGGDVVFVRSTNDNRDLWLCNVDNGTERQLTRSRGEESYPVWSPDGEWIAYVLRDGDSRSLMVCAVDGSDRRAIAKIDGTTYAPSWSPSGNRIAFSVGERGAKSEVFTVRFDGTERKRIASGAFCAWQLRR